MIARPLQPTGIGGGPTSTGVGMIPRAEETTTSAGGVSASDLVAEAQNHWNVSGASIVAAWLLTAIAGVLIVSLYSWKRERYPLIFAPRVNSQKEKKKRWDGREGINPPLVPVVDTGFLAWLKPQVKDVWYEIWMPCRQKSMLNRDYELLKLLGLDAVTYLQFLRLLRWLFLTISIVAALPLTLVNYHLNTNTQYGSTSSSATSSTTPNLTTRAEVDRGSQNATSILDNMQLFTAANIKGKGLAAQIAAEWVVTIIILFFVVAHTSYHNKLVLKWAELNQNEISFKSLMVTNLNIQPRFVRTSKNGKKYTTDTLVSDAKIQVCLELGIKERPYPRAKNQPADCSVTLTYKNMSRLARLMEEFKGHVYPDFERILTEYLRRFKGYLGGGSDYGSCWDRALGRAQSIEERTNQKGKEMEKLKKEIEHEQANARGRPEMEDILPIGSTITSAFITFATAKQAHQVLQEAKQHVKYKLNGPDVQRAPRSRNIIWKNLDKHGASKHGINWLGQIALIIVFFVNTVPLIFVTLLANLDWIVEQWDVTRNLRDDSSFWKGIFAILGGILPPTIAGLFAYFLPHVLDKSMIRQLFIFLLISNFVGFSLLGIIWETYATISTEIGKKSWREIYESLGDVPVKITQVYISISSYWLSWYPLRATMLTVQLLQLPRVLLKVWQTLTAKTASDIHQLAQPVNFEFGESCRSEYQILIQAIEYIHVLFAMVVALVYTPLAPLVSICSTIYFWTMGFIHYNQLKYVEDSKESDGKSWHVVRNRLLASTVIMQLLMTLTIGLKTKSPEMTLAAFLPTTFILALKQVESRTNIFPKTTELIGGTEVSKPKMWKIPEFEHELLRRDWMPEFIWHPSDHEQLMQAKEKFPWMRSVLRRRDKTKEKGEMAKKDKGAKNGKRKKRKP